MVAALTLLVGVAACMAGPYKPMAPPFVEWVRNGKPVACIVADRFGTEGSEPAEILNGYVGKITGARLPVVREAEARSPVVYIGPKAGLARVGGPDRLGLGPEGIAVLSRGRDLIIGGRNALATIYAVCAFLEECLGVRWFWAGDSGEHVPHTPTLRVGRVRMIQNPHFRWRWVGRGQWALFNRMNVAVGHPEEFKTKWSVHTFLRLVPPEKYWPAHPEYYAEISGKRQDPTQRSRQVQLCTSNPRVAEIVAQTIDEILSREPGLHMISVDPMDSQNFCQCENCRALDEPDAPYARKNSRRLVLFYNRVAELVARRHPDLLIKSIAYHSYVSPPADPKLRVRDNVVIQFCRFECHNHPLDDPNCPKNRDFNRYLLGWRRIAKNVVMYEYYFKASWVHLPWPIVHTLKRDIPYLRRIGVMGLFTQYTYNFATNGLDYYIAAKLLWNSELDVDALVEDFCEKAFGEAAAPMAEYYRLLEEAAQKSGVHLASQRPFDEVIRLFTPELMAKLDDALARARAVVKDHGAKRRVEMMAQGLHYTHLVVDYLSALARLRKSAGTTLWAGAITPEIREEAKRIGGPLAEAIRAFITDPKTAPAVGRMNSYVENMLRPDRIIGAWVETPLGGGGVRLTKVQWLEQHPQRLSTRLPKRFCLWVYGNDLDYVNGKAEHTILAVGPDGRETVIGRVGTADRPGNGRNLCYILDGLTPALMVDGALRLIVTNDEGGPYASRFYAFYVMPADPEVTEEQATQLIENNIEQVRRRAFGFAEYTYSGMLSWDNDRDAVTIEVAGVPAAK